MRSRLRQLSGLICTALLSLISSPQIPTAASQVEDSHRQWVLVFETRILPEPVGSSDSYRLAWVSMGQLIALQSNKRPVFAWKSIPIKEHAASRNIRIRRAFEDANFGEARGTTFVQLNEPVALRFEDRGYLVYSGSGSGPKDLTRAANSLVWQSESHFNQVTSSPDIYQWRFENPRDHRDAVDLKTKDEVALFNVVSRCYLVVREKRLAWERP